MQSVAIEMELNVFPGKIDWVLPVILIFVGLELQLTKGLIYNFQFKYTLFKCFSNNCFVNNVARRTISVARPVTHKFVSEQN